MISLSVFCLRRKKIWGNNIQKMLTFSQHGSIIEVKALSQGLEQAILKQAGLIKASTCAK